MTALAARRTLGCLGIAAWALLAVPAGAEELLLPAPEAATTVQAASIRIEALPRPDGAFDATVTLALTGGAQGERLALLLPPVALSSVNVAGSDVPPPADHRLEVVVGASEAVLVRLGFRVEPDLLDWVPTTDAGWVGRARGPLLQPALRFVVRHPDDSAFAGVPVSARVAPGDVPLTSLLQSPAGRLARGEASWEGVVVKPPQRLVLTWPLLLDELLPRDRAEAEALSEDLLQRDIPGVEYERLRDAVAASGEPGAAAAASVLASLSSERARRVEAMEREKKRQDEEAARRVAAKQAEEREKATAEAAAREAQERARREAQEQAARDAEARAQADREAALRPPVTPSQPPAQQPPVPAPSKPPAEAAPTPPPQADREAQAREARAQADREAQARAAQAQADREAQAREARAQAEREAQAREAQAQADREAQAREARAQADREAQAREAQAQADREAQARRTPDIAERRERLAEAASEVQERDAREQLARSMARPAGTPWIRSAAAAREFLSSASPDRAGIEEAIATVRAHWGEPFRYERRWRERFAAEPWYAPRREDALLPATEGEIAALEVLAQALD